MTTPPRASPGPERGLGVTAQTPPPWLQELAQAVQSRRSQQLAQTLQHFAGRFLANRQDAEALYGLGLLARQIGRGELALRLLGRAHDLAPERVDFLGDLANTFSQIGRLEDAIARYQQVLGLDPSNALALNNLGNTHQQQGDLDAAIAAYEQALASQPDYADAWSNLAGTLEHADRFEAAEAAFKKALALKPDHPKALLNLGTAYHKRGRIEDAVTHLERACRLTPPSSAAFNRLQRLYLEQGDYARVAALCREVQSFAPGNQFTQAAQAICCLAEGDRAGFRALCRMAGWPHSTLLTPKAETIAARNAALTEDILNHPALKWIHDSHDTSKRGFVYGLLDEPTDAITAFTEDLLAHVQTLKAGLPQDSAHPFFGRLPGRVKVNLWATVLNAGGWHPSHHHERNWLSGTYYVRVPDLAPTGAEPRPGWIEFDGFTHLPGLAVYRDEVFSVEPEEGRLVLFPSYLLHGTRPFASEGLRISLAFDLEPVG